MSCDIDIEKLRVAEPTEVLHVRVPRIGELRRPGGELFACSRHMDAHASQLAKVKGRKSLTADR